jgi:hypothetical protein
MRVIFVRLSTRVRPSGDVGHPPPNVWRRHGGERRGCAPTESPYPPGVRPSGVGCGDRAASVDLAKERLFGITRLLGCDRPEPRKTAPDARVGRLARRIAMVQQQPRLAKGRQPTAQPFTARSRPTPFSLSCWTTAAEMVTDPASVQDSRARGPGGALMEALQARYPTSRDQPSATSRATVFRKSSTAPGTPSDHPAGGSRQAA